ncbi:MAG TPA: hypothetical protein VE054_03325, partial [Blattabacteriaceae bacterium]|nr:hypothetical protein [Blattabacteriaceae bacterium]
CIFITTRWPSLPNFWKAFQTGLLKADGRAGQALHAGAENRFINRFIKKRIQQFAKDDDNNSYAQSG